MKKLLFAAIFLGWLCLSACSSGKKDKDCKTCKDFKTQTEAKTYAKANKKCKKQLDSDADGIYCESLPR